MYTLFPCSYFTMDIHTLLEITYSKFHPLCHVVLRRQQMLLRVSDVVIHFWKWFFHDFWSICLGTSFRFRKNKIGEQLFQMWRVISNATAKETPPNKCKLFQENRENNKNNISKEMCVSGQQTTTKQKTLLDVSLKLLVLLLQISEHVRNNKSNIANEKQANLSPVLGPISFLKNGW